MCDCRGIRVRFQTEHDKEIPMTNSRIVLMLALATAAAQAGDWPPLARPLLQWLHR